jgi:hypothetical protein
MRVLGVFAAVKGGQSLKHSHGEWDVKLNAKGAEEDAKGAMESLSPTVRML